MQTRQQQLLPLVVVVATITGATTMAEMATTMVAMATTMAETATTTTTMEVVQPLLLLLMEMQLLLLPLQETAVSFSSSSNLRVSIITAMSDLPHLAVSANHAPATASEQWVPAGWTCVHLA